MLSKMSQMQPKKKLRIYTVALIFLSSVLFLLTLTSLSLTASNLMVTTQLSTPSQLQTFQRQHHSYMTSQRMIVAFDVLSIAAQALLIFSVFRFYTKGNMIIIVINIIFQIIRWISAVVFRAGESQLRTSWSNLWESAEYGKSVTCDIESCGQSVINFVICGKLKLWHETQNFQLGFAVFSVPLVIGVLLLSYLTNKLDLNLVQFSQATD